MRKEGQDGAGTGDYRVGMVCEKSERTACNMVFGRTSFQQGRKVPIGYLELRFWGRGWRLLGP